MPSQRERSNDKDTHSPQSEEKGPTGDQQASPRGPEQLDQHWRARIAEHLTGRAKFLPALLCLLLGGIVLGFSALVWVQSGGSPLGLGSAFLGALLLAGARVFSGTEFRQESNSQILIPSATGLRAAVILALLLLVWLELDLLKGVLSAGGFAAKLLPALLPSTEAAGPTQAPGGLVIGVVHTAAGPRGDGTAWPSAFVAVVLIAAITIMVLVTLFGIWRVAREE